MNYNKRVKESRGIIMKKTSLRALFICILITIGISLSACNTASERSTAASPEETPSEGATSDRLEDRYDEVLEKLKTLEQIIDKYYLFQDEIDIDAQIEGIYAGFVNGLAEPYTTYFTAEEYKTVMESTQGIYSGIGVMVSQNINTGVITVVRSVENGPGYEAGIRKDDILYKVGGEEVTGKDLAEVVARIKGEEGTTVDLTIYRQSENKYIDMTVERRIVETPTVEYEMKENNIGYIQVSQFEEVTLAQFNQAIEDLQDQGMKGLVVDVRDNPGGLLTTVCDMLNRLLPEGRLVYTLDRDGNKEEKFSDNEEVLDIPMVVLVNGNSASASEIFAAALQDYEWATIMGTTTFGKGVVQVIIPLQDGSAIKLTTSEYFSPKGNRIHELGVAPNIVIEEDKEAEGDNQIQAAIEEMNRMLKE